jgi:hypothetical protein
LGLLGKNEGDKDGIVLYYSTELPMSCSVQMMVSEMMKKLPIQFVKVNTFLMEHLQPHMVICFEEMQPLLNFIEKNVYTSHACYFSFFLTFLDFLLVCMCVLCVCFCFILEVVFCKCVCLFCLFVFFNMCRKRSVLLASFPYWSIKTEASMDPISSSSI